MPHSKLLHHLLDKNFINQHQLIPNMLIEHITSDSREVIKNTLFLACSGINVEGASFIKQAIEKGASLVLTETEVAMTAYLEVPILFVPKLKEILAALFSNFYSVTLNTMCFIGITGTNGKTSVAHMLAQIMESIYVGTIGIGPVNALLPTQNTTPSLETLMPSISTFQKNNFSTMVLEISSHALEQKRLKNMPISTAVFTNLSHEHLDYHGSMAAYAGTKYRLFLDEPLIKNAVIFIEDEWGNALVKKLPSSVNYLTYGMNKKADIYPLSMRSDLENIKLRLNTPRGELSFALPLIGDFNALNSMAVVGVLLLNDWPLLHIKKGLEGLHCISGRMEVMSHSPTFIVDYAHTPDALEKALKSLKPLCQGKLWCVFGCGGDRDPSKRALMGAIAKKHADRVIITNDNPRNEDPLTIVEAIKKGINSLENIEVILDRKTAIAHCFEHSNPEDAILIAGKGHEDYQIIGGQKTFFSDQETIKHLL